MIGAFFDGLPCALDPRTRYVRARGCEPSTSSVFMPESQFKALRAKIEAGATLGDPRFEGIGTSSAELSLPVAFDSKVPASSSSFPQREFLPHRGDLVFMQRIRRGDAHAEEPKLHVRDLFLVEVRFDDSELAPSLVELVLVDVRYFWPRYGLATGRWNVRRPDGTLVPRYARVSVPSREVIPIPLREIFQRMLNSLPGRLQIVRWPDKADHFPAPEVQARGASPYDILRELLARYRLSLDIGPDLCARIFAPGEGEVGAALERGEPDNDDSFDPETMTGLWSGELVAGGKNYTSRPDHMVPTEIAVVGKPAVFSVWIDYLEPVLYRTVVDPVSLEPRPQIIDVSLHNLEKFVRGEFDPPVLAPGSAVTPEVAQRLREWDNVVLQRAGEPAKPEGLSVVPSLVDFTSQLSAARYPVQPPTGRSPFFWLRFPILYDSPHNGPHFELIVRERIPIQALEILGRQLWRYYRVPEHLRRLLPILDRAEVSPLGKRLPPLVFAAGFEQIQVLEPGTVTPHGQRLALLAQLDEHRASLFMRRRRLLDPTFSDVKTAITGGDPEAEERVRNKIEALGLALAKEVTGANLQDANAAELVAIERAIGETNAAIHKIEDEVDPTLPIKRRLYALEQEKDGALRNGGRPSNRIRAAIEDELSNLRKAEAELAKLEAESKKPITRHKLRNLPRRPVPFVVVDAASGIIAVDQLPMWVSDEEQPVPENCYGIPMPVALWCGTYNDADPEFREGIPPNGFTKAIAARLGEAPDVRAFLGHVGHRLPQTESEGSEGLTETLFTFTPTNLRGDAKVGPHPFVIRDPGMQLLVKLDGLDNRTVMMARALGHASPILAPSLVRDAGTLEVIGPRPVLCNGRITAVDVYAMPSEKGSVGSWVTRISFDGDAAPLPGVTGDVLEPGPVRLSFGIDHDPALEAAL